MVVKPDKLCAQMHHHSFLCMNILYHLFGVNVRKRLSVKYSNVLHLLLKSFTSSDGYIFRV